MNKKMRKALSEIKDAMEGWSSGMAEVTAKLEELAEVEREHYDNLPEGLQMSERGEKYEESAGALETAYDAVTDMLEKIEEAKGLIEEVLESIDEAANSIDDAMSL